jgi:hypothetical protein
VHEVFPVTGVLRTRYGLESSTLLFEILNAGLHDAIEHAADLTFISQTGQSC